MAALNENKLSAFAYTVEMGAKKGKAHLVPLVAIAADLKDNLSANIFEMTQEERSNACYRLYCEIVNHYSWKDVAAFLHFCIQLVKGKTGPQDMLAFLTNCRNNPVAFGFIGACAVEQAIFGSTNIKLLDGNLQSIILDKCPRTGNPQYGAVCEGTCKNDKFVKMRWPSNSCKVCRSAKLPPAFDEPVTLLKVPVALAPAQAGQKQPRAEQFRVAEWGDEKSDDEKPADNESVEEEVVGVGVPLFPSDGSSPAPPQQSFSKAPTKAWTKAWSNKPVQRLGFPPLPVGRAVPDVQKAQLQEALLAEQEKARQLQLQKDASDKLLQEAKLQKDAGEKQLQEAQQQSEKLLQEARQQAEQQAQQVAQLRQELQMAIEMANLRQELQDAKLEKERLKLENERLMQSHSNIGELAFVQGTPAVFTTGKFLRGSAAVQHFSC